MTKEDFEKVQDLFLEEAANYNVTISTSIHDTKCHFHIGNEEIDIAQILKNFFNSVVIHSDKEKI